MKNADKVLTEMDFYNVGTLYIKDRNFVVDLEKIYFLLKILLNKL